MFTGLVQAIGAVCGRATDGAGIRLDVDVSGLPGPFRIGDSIALSGVCCTVVELAGGVASFHLTPETLARTWLGQAAVGDRLNLEGALRAGDPLGGHLVQGHVDGTGTVGAVTPEGDGRRVSIVIPEPLRRYVAVKGSLAVDGTSLTVAALTDEGCEIAYIPHTLAITSAGDYRPGRRVNLEVDLLARYLARLLDDAGVGRKS